MKKKKKKRRREKEKKCHNIVIQIITLSLIIEKEKKCHILCNVFNKDAKIQILIIT